MSQKCRWWNSWLHQRRRLCDINTMWPAIVARASDVNAGRRAWTQFMQQPGQEHWRCECSKEVAAFMELFHFYADAEPFTERGGRP